MFEQKHLFPFGNENTTVSNTNRSMLRSAILKDINSAACSLVLKSLNDSRIQIAVYTANQSVANGTRDYFRDLQQNDNDFPRYHVEGTSFSVSDQNKIFSVDLRNQAPSYKVLESLNKEITIMHPGPINRGVELTSDVADSSHSLILDQVENGVAIRMAVLFLLSNKLN